MSLKTLTVQGITTAFYDNIKKNVKDSTRFATKLTTKTEMVNFAFLRDIPAFTKWTGSHQFGDLDAVPFPVTTEKFGDAIKLTDEQIDDDQTGTVITLAKSLADSVPFLKNDLVANTLNNNPNCFDGQPLFANNHKIEKGTQSNIVSGAITDSNVSEKLNAAVDLLYKMKTYRGKAGVVNSTQRLVWIIPTDMRAIAKKAVQTDTLPAGGSNPDYNLAKVVVAPQLTNSNKSFLFNDAAPLKALIYVLRRDVKLRNWRDNNEEAQKFAASIRATVAPGQYASAVQLTGA